MSQQILRLSNRNLCIRRVQPTRSFFHFAVVQTTKPARFPADKTPHDAASSNPGKKAPRDASGNPEDIGFADQVGSQSATAMRYKHGSGQEHDGAGEEESMPPDLLGAAKTKLGFGANTGKTKQSRGGSAGVTGTGTLPGSKRALHGSAVLTVDPTRGQAPDASRKPRDRPYGEQNPHLKHKPADEAAGPDKGKGNAGETPSLPSHKFGKTSGSKASQPRAFSTSAYLADAKHTAESYFKDVDDQPPMSSKVHQVDGSVTGATIQRPSAPETGEWNEAGSQTPEYASVNKEEPYDVPPSSGPESTSKLRYGGTERLEAHASGNGGGDSVSKPNEGPAGTSKGGRKPEGRS